jgi:hypothetical protein
MLAYHNDPAIKAKYVQRVELHAAADEIIHGKYWERGKGCAVGCTIHSSNHAAYESELGIPIMLARLEDRLFEGMANGDSKLFPGRFLQAITPGADLSRVGWQFLYWLLTEELASRADPRVAKEIKACADVLIPLTKGEPCDRKAAGLARRAALDARQNLWNAYTAGAYTAAAYAAYAAAADAAAAAYAAYAGAYTAAAAAAAADAAGAYTAAAAAAAADAARLTKARLACYHRMADKLLELMASPPLAPVQAFFARAA